MGATPDTSISIPTTATDAVIITYVGRGYNVSSASAFYQAGSFAYVSNSTASVINSPSVTPTTAKSTIIYGCAEPSGAAMIPAHGTRLVAGWHSATDGMMVVESFHPDTTATAAYPWERNHPSLTNINAVYTFVLVDDGTGQTRSFIDWNTNPVVTPIHWMGASGHGGQNTSTASADPTIYIPSIYNDSGSAVTTAYAAYGYQTNIIQGGNYSASQGVTTKSLRIAASILSGIPSLSGKNICLSPKFSAITPISKRGDVGVVFGLSDGTNTRIWNIGGSNTNPNPTDGYFPVLIDPDGGYEWDAASGGGDIGTVTLSSCDRVITGFQTVDNNNIYVFWSPIVLTETIYIEDADGIAASMADIADYTKLNGLNTWNSQSGQTDAQYIGFQSVEIQSNWNGDTQSAAFPDSYDDAAGRVQAMIGAAGLSFLFNIPDGKTVSDRNKIVYGGNYHIYGTKSGTSTDASSNYNFNGAAWVQVTPYLNAINGAIGGLLIADSKEVVYTTLADMSGGVTFSGCVDAQQLTITGATQAALQLEVDKLDNCSFNNMSNIGLNINFTGTGNVTLAFTGMTFSGNATDVNYHSTNASALEIQDDGSGILAANCTISGAATGVTVTAPTTTLRINPDVTISAAPTGVMRYFRPAVSEQTPAGSDSGDFLDYEYADTTPIDIEVVEQGYVPVNQQNVTPFNGTLTIEMDFDEAYNASHSLTIVTHYTYDRTTKALNILADQNAFDVRSSMADTIRLNSSYYNTPLLLEAKPGGKRIDLIDGATIADMATWKGAGMERYDALGTIYPIEKWYAIQSVQDITGASVIYRQTNSGDFTVGSLTGGKFDEALKFYEDTTVPPDNNPETNNDSYLLIKALQVGYRQARNDVVAGNGGASLKADLYTIGLAPTAHDYAGNPATDLSLTMTLVAGPFTVGGKTFAYKWVDAGTNSGSDIADWINYMGATSPNGLIPGSTGLRWAEMPDMVIHVSGGVETERGYQEGATPTLVGFYCQRGVSDHPDFIRFQADDGTYYTPAVQVSILMPNIPDGARVRIYNEDSSAEIDNSLVTGGGGYSFALLYTADINISYKVNWHSGTNAKLPLTGIGVITSAGFTLLDSMEDDTKHNALGFDGEAIDLDASPATGEIKADFANIQIDANDPDGVFDSRKGIAWWRYICSTATGIATYNPKALQYNPDVRNIEVDGQLQIENIHPTLPLKVTEGLWIRKDGASIIASTSNTVWWVPNDRVYQGPETGVSGLTAAESAKLDTIGTVNTNTSAIKAKTDQLTFTAPNVVDASASVSEASIRAAIGLASANLDTQLATITEDTNELQTNQGNWITATGFATVNPDNASIAVIKGKTDQLTFTLANQVDANAQSINDNAVTGDGSEADPWRKTGVTP